MLKDITLGQYFPGDTVVHRLDPRTKLILVILYIVALFQAKGWISYAAVLLVTIVCMALSHISFKNIFKGLKPMLFIIVLTAMLNIFYTTGTPIVEGWIITWDSAHHRYLPVDLYHQPDGADRRLGAAPEPAQKAQSARA